LNQKGEERKGKKETVQGRRRESREEEREKGRRRERRQFRGGGQ